MNIDSIQAANPPQRAATPEVSLQANRQGKAASSTPAQQNAPQADTRRDANSEQKQLSVQDAVKRLENFVSIARADINFSIDEVSGIQVVKIMDRQSKEVIRQFPSEEAIRIAQALDQLQGVFVRDKV